MPAYERRGNYDPLTAAFVMYFEADNAAFDEPVTEAARILRRVAEKIERGEDIEPVYHTILDANGNDVGRWRYAPRGGDQ